MFAFIIAVVLKAFLGKYIESFVPVPLWFFMLLILMIMIAAQALGLPISSFYAGFFSWLSGLLGGA